jgi:ATPase subunit of ABC transporter with duplicated ATPase domains
MPCGARAGVNGAGKTTQLQIITGALTPDSGSVLKERPNMRIAYLTQEFDVEPTRTVRVSAACTVMLGFARLQITQQKHTNACTWHAWLMVVLVALRRRSS